MTITSMLLPLNNNFPKRSHFGLLAGSNSSESAAISGPSNFGSTANLDSYFAIFRQRSDHNPTGAVGCLG